MILEVDIIKDYLNDKFYRLYNAEEIDILSVFLVCKQWEDLHELTEYLYTHVLRIDNCYDCYISPKSTDAIYSYVIDEGLDDKHLKEVAAIYPYLNFVSEECNCCYSDLLLGFNSPVKFTTSLNTICTACKENISDVQEFYDGMYITMGPSDICLYLVCLY